MPKISFKDIFKTDDSHEFEPILSEIENKPINPLGRAIFWTLLALIFVTVLILYLGKVDVVVSAQSRVIPDGNIKIIQPLEIGVVDSILVKEGDLVKKGDILVKINPSSVDPALESTRRNLLEIKEEIDRLKGNSSYSGSSQLQRSIGEAQYSTIQNQVRIKYTELAKTNEQIQAVQSQIKNNAYLLAQAKDKELRLEEVLDIISHEEYNKTLSEISQYTASGKELNHKIAELNKQKTQLNHEVALINSNQRRENLETANIREKEIAQLEAQVKEIEFKSMQQKIASPVDGHISTILISTVGGVVTPAQQLMSVIPIDTPLLVKATVLSKDIGFVKEGMDVSLKVDTFNFQKYGLLEGVVKTVSKDSIKDEQLGLIYEVFITPKTTTLMVEGRQEPLRPGMSVTSEIKTAKRRIIEFFIYPLTRYLKESVGVR